MITGGILRMPVLSTTYVLDHILPRSSEALSIMPVFKPAASIALRYWASFHVSCVVLSDADA